jgi:hypothetical protein
VKIAPTDAISGMTNTKFALSVGVRGDSLSSMGEDRGKGKFLSRQI